MKEPIEINAINDEKLIVGQAKGESHLDISLEPVLRMRANGKALCTRLKNARKALADANGIPYEIERCPNEGPCAGTCEKCDAEIEYLTNELEKIPEEKRIIPKLNIKPFRDSSECKSSQFYEGDIPIPKMGMAKPPINPEWLK